MMYFLESNDNNLDIKSFQRLGASFEAVKTSFHAIILM